MRDAWRPGAWRVARGVSVWRVARGAQYLFKGEVVVRADRDNAGACEALLDADPFTAVPAAADAALVPARNAGFPKILKPSRTVVWVHTVGVLVNEAP